MTTTILRPTLQRERTDVRILEVQSREGHIKWTLDDGLTTRSGLLRRGVFDSEGYVLRDTDPRDAYVRITSVVNDVFLAWEDLADLLDSGRAAIPRL